MAVNPISGQPVQYFNVSSTFAEGYYLKMYAFNTTDPINMFTDSTGATTLDKCVIDSMGYPTTDGVTRFIPHSDRSYDLACYQNADDADNDRTGQAEWFVSGILQFQTEGSDAWTLFNSTPTQISSTVFTVTGDQTAVFPVGTRLRFTDTSTLYGVVSAVAYGVVTSVTVNLDSGVLSSQLSAVYTSIATAANKDLSASSIAYLNTDLTLYKIYELENLLNELPISVKMAGAVMNGSTDDHAVVQALFDAAGGREFYIPSGSTMIISTLLRPASGATISGGGYNSVIKASGTTVFAGSWAGASNAAGMFTLYGTTGVTIKNLRLEGNLAAKNDAQIMGIQLMYAIDTTLENIWIKNIPSNNLSPTLNAGEGIFITGDTNGTASSRLQASNIYIDNVIADGIDIDNGNQLQFDNIDIRTAGVCGLNVGPEATETVRHVSVNNMNVDACNVGICIGHLGTADMINIKGGTVHNCNSSGLKLLKETSGTPVAPTAISITGTQFLSNVTNQDATNGDIWIEHGEGVTITGVQTRGSGGHGMIVEEGEDITIKGNIVKDARASGIGVRADYSSATGTNIDGLTISDNIISGNGTAALSEKNGIDIVDDTNKYIDNLHVADNIFKTGGTQVYGILINFTVAPFPITNGENWSFSNNTRSQADELRPYCGKTISAGAIDVDGLPYFDKMRYIYLTAEGGGPTDTLTDITGGEVGDVIAFAAVTGDTITFSNSGGNIKVTNIVGGTEIITGGNTANIQFMKNEANNWIMVSENLGTQA